MPWPWTRRPVIERSAPGPTVSIGDPALADFLGIGGANDSGENVNESTALGVTAFYRGVRLIADTIAALPLKTYRDTGDSNRENVGSFLDRPGGSFMTPYTWKQTVVAYGAMYGAAPLLHVYNDAGALDWLLPLHPSTVSVEWDEDAGERRFAVTVERERRVFTPADLTYVIFFTRDGIRGCGPLELHRNVLGSAIAGDKAAARMFANGLLLGGLVTPKEGLSDRQAVQALTGLKAKMTGTRNAGDLVMINAALDVQPWTMNAEDAQFLESRQYGVEEVARILGVPKELLSAAGATSWGSGIQELVRGFSRFTLPAYTTPLEESLSPLLANPRFCEFEYAGLMQGTPSQEIDLLIREVQNGILTVNEARAIRNLPPLNVVEINPDAAVAPANDEGNIE
jgi:HK97 family phage portal protein